MVLGGPPPIVVGVRVDTSALYPEFPLATVVSISKKDDTCTLEYPDSTRDPPRKITWVRDNCVVYPCAESYAAAIYYDDSSRWFVKGGACRKQYRMRRDVLSNDLEEEFIACAEKHGGFWLPVTPPFVKLQAKETDEPLVYGWWGILPPQDGSAPMM